ncbi:recombinase family protein [Actinomycetospora termitidis]|uniref:Recombinase family protein n=1 Tax=Actinomycetospora termitidis TaxID=3053470 RepID=A0ABT7M570_9PSEU|nr:recombinase family protein [Actinomycetospora sp. Odt1-22]MDL5155829.1 recombinase family protein [Actinomycetospora sp. Odt1-22]
MLRGYARVASTTDDAGDQVERLEAAGVAAGTIRVDTSLGTRGARPALETVLGELRPGDVLVVTGLDRLASSVLHLVQVGQRLHALGADLRSLDERVDTVGEGEVGVLPTLELLAGLQRTLVSASTRAGLDAARARGRRGGRPPRLTAESAAEAQRLYDEGRSVTEIAEKLDVPRTTVYGHLRRPT